MNFSTWKLRIECAREAGTVVAGRQICPSGVSNAWHHDFSIPGFVQCHQPSRLALTSPGLLFPTRRLEKKSPGLVSRNSPACPLVPGLHAPGAMPFESAVRSLLKDTNLCALFCPSPRLPYLCNLINPTGQKVEASPIFRATLFHGHRLSYKSLQLVNFKINCVQAATAGSGVVRQQLTIFIIHAKQNPFFFGFRQCIVAVFVQ